MSAAARRTLRELERLSACGLDSLAFRHAALREVRRARRPRVIARGWLPSSRYVEERRWDPRR
jgi:hypothetical protein